MSYIFGKWASSDISSVIESLDKKTGLNANKIHVITLDRVGKYSHDLGIYRTFPETQGQFFIFSTGSFNGKDFSDRAVIDAVRHAYCHYVVDQLNLCEIYGDDGPHGKAWKTVCGLLNTDPTGVYNSWYFRRISENTFLNLAYSNDIPRTNIIEQIDRWGKELPPLIKRPVIERKIVKNYSRARLFKPNDTIIHEKYGKGTVIETFPTYKKQYLYVAFENGDTRKVQNCHSLKVVNDKIVVPAKTITPERFSMDDTD